MFFRNLHVYRLPSPWNVQPTELNWSLAARSWKSCASFDAESIGWIAPLNQDGFVHVVGDQMLLALYIEKKLLPSAVINQAVRLRAAELEEQQGYKPGRKQLKEIKEDVIDQLLPKAFSTLSTTTVWIDPVNGWLVINTSSSARADLVLKNLFKCVDSLPIESLHVVQSPKAAMTSWLVSDEAPAGFTIDQDTTLRANTDSKAQVQYSRHTLEADDVRRHIEAGKQCTKLAMTWCDRISFVLTDTLAIKRVTPLDVMKESANPSAMDVVECFDSDFMLMAGELNKLLSDLVQALGGEQPKREAA